LCIELGQAWQPNYVPVADLATNWGPIDHEDQRLVLVGWSPARMTLENPAMLTEVQTRFNKLINYFGAPLEHTAVWQPESDDIVALQVALSLGKDNESVRHALLNSVWNNSTCIYVPRQTKQPPSRSYAELLRGWRDTVPETAAVQQRRVAALREAFAVEVLDPLRREAERAETPLKAPLYEALVTLMEMFHDDVMATVTRPAATPRQQHLDEIRPRLTLVDRMLAVIRELTTWPKVNLTRT